MANPRVRIVDTASRPVVVIDRAPAHFAQDLPPVADAVVLVFADEVDLDDDRVTSQIPGLPTGRVPAADLRRPDLPGVRHPGEDLGEEEVHGEEPG